MYSWTPFHTVGTGTVTWKYFVIRHSVTCRKDDVLSSGVLHVADGIAGLRGSAHSHSFPRRWVIAFNYWTTGGG